MSIFIIELLIALALFIGYKLGKHDYSKIYKSLYEAKLKEKINKLKDIDKINAIFNEKYYYAIDILQELLFEFWGIDI